MPLFLSTLAGCYAELGKFDDAWHHIVEAAGRIKTSKETWCEAEVNRIAGKIALKSPQPDVAKAEGYFERALAVCASTTSQILGNPRAMSMARLRRDQGKHDEARDLLAPVYGWFTEG
jgi:predicted ATPase